MAGENTYTSQAAVAEPGDSYSSNRQQQLEQLFNRTYPSILELVQRDPRLTVYDHNRLIDGLSNRLNDYDGPLDNAAFLAWAEDVLRPAMQLHAILREHKGAIYGGIRSGLGLGTQAPNFFDDDKALVEDIYQEVLCLIFLLVDSFSEPGDAALSTRLFALAERHTLDYHTKKLRWRYELGETYPTSIQECECLSNAELASMAEDDAEESYA